MAWTAPHIMLHVAAVAVYLLCAYHVTIFAVCPWRGKCELPMLRRLCIAAWRRVLAAVRFTKESPESPLVSDIKEHMNDFRLVQCLKFVKVGLHCAAPILIMWTIATQVSAASAPPEDILVFRLAFFGSIYFVALLVARRDIQLTPRRLDALVAVVNILSVGAIATMTDAPDFLLQHSSRLFFRIILSLAQLDYSFSIPWNTAASIVTCWRYPYNASVINAGDDMDMLYFMFRELFLCMGVNGGCYAVQMCLETRVQVQIIARNQMQATLKVAARKCDAVFLLSPDLHLNAPAPELANVLAVEGTNNDLKGRSFENYIASEVDRERFRECLALPAALSELDGLPSSLNIDMLDSRGQIFPAQVYHASVAGEGDQIWHVVGISGCPERRTLGRQQKEAQQTGELNEVDPAIPAPLERKPTDFAIMTSPQAGAGGAVERPRPSRREGMPRKTEAQVARELSRTDFRSGAPPGGQPSDSQALRGRQAGARSAAENSMSGVVLSGNLESEAQHREGLNQSGNVVPAPLERRPSDSEAVRGPQVGAADRSRSDAVPLGNQERSERLTGGVNQVAAICPTTAIRRRPSDPAAVRGEISTAEISRTDTVHHDTVQSAGAHSSDASQSSWSDAVLAPVIPDRRNVAPVALMFDGATHEIVGCTLGFMALVGPVIYKTHMGEYLFNHREFVPWVQVVVSEFMQSGAARDNAFDVKGAETTCYADRRFEFKAAAYMVDVGFDVRATELGVESRAERFEDPKHGTLCLMEFRDIQGFWVDVESGSEPQAGSNDAVNRTVVL